MVFVSFTGLDGSTILVNVGDLDLAELTAIPTGSLPTGVANGTNIDYSDGRRIQVQGTPAATANILAGGGVAPSNAVYVDTNGDDATGQRGSAAFPFLTMAAAMAVVQSGDEVLVSPGTYSGAFTMANVANVVIRGSGNFASETVLTAANAIDVCTLAPANRSILFDNIQVAGATTGRAIVGTGAAAARAWLSTGFGLQIQECTISSATGVPIDLTYANAAFIRDSIVTGGAAINLTVCGPVVIDDTLCSADVLYSWDEADALRPNSGQGTLALRSGTQVGAVTLAGLQTVGPVLTGGSPKLTAAQGTKMGSLTGLNLGDNANAHLSITVHGEVGAVDFQSAAAKQLPDTATALGIDFVGAILTANGASAMLFKVGGAAVNAQTVNAQGLTCKSAATYTADVKVSLILKGAGLSNPTYATPGASGDILPPFLNGTIDISAGGALVKTWAALGHASLVRVTSAAYSAQVTSAIQGADAVVPVAGKVVTGFTITSTAQAGNTANWAVQWAA